MEKAEKQEIFNRFIQKAEQRLEDKRAQKTMRIYMPSMDEEITVRSLTNEELMEITNIEDPSESDNYSFYLSVIEPNLAAVAKTMVEQGKIMNYTDIVGIFNLQERKDVVREVLKLSDVISDKRIEVIKELKN